MKSCADSLEGVLTDIETAVLLANEFSYPAISISMTNEAAIELVKALKLNQECSQPSPKNTNQKNQSVKKEDKR